MLCWKQLLIWTFDRQFESKLAGWLVCTDACWEKCVCDWCSPEEHLTGFTWGGFFKTVHLEVMTVSRAVLRTHVRPVRAHTHTLSLLESDTIQKNITWLGQLIDSQRHLKLLQPLLLQLTRLKVQVVAALPV